MNTSSATVSACFAVSATAARVLPNANRSIELAMSSSSRGRTPAGNGTLGSLTDTNSHTARAVSTLGAPSGGSASRNDSSFGRPERLMAPRPPSSGRDVPRSFFASSD
jgi:hypothetical protein